MGIRKSLIRRVISATLLLNCAQNTLANEAKTLVSKSPIPAHCQDSYLKGAETYRIATEKNLLSQEKLDQRNLLFDEGASTTPEDCKFAYAMGIYDSQANLWQRMILEYFLELEAAANKRIDVTQVHSLYKKRALNAGYSPQKLLAFNEQKQFQKESLDKFRQSMRQLAKRKNTYIPFGRFAFTAADGMNTFSLYEFKTGKDGKWLLDGDDSPLIASGTYQERAALYWKMARDVASAYVNWKPGVIYGEYSWLNGAWAEIFDPELKNPREVKEASYFNSVYRIKNQAAIHGLDTAPFWQLLKLMNAKQANTLKSDLHTLDRIQMGLYAAPLIPIGMYLGTAGLAYSGLKSVPVGTSMFSLSAGSLASASNISASISLATIAAATGIGAHKAYTDYQDAKTKGRTYKFSQFADSVVTSVVTSFPLAAALPAIVGGSTAMGKIVIADTMQIIASMRTVYGSATTLGLRGSLSTLRSLPSHWAKSWVSAWWKRPSLIIRYFSGTGITAFFEIGYRQLFLSGSEKFYYFDKDGNPHLNDTAVFRVGSAAILNAVTGPMIYIENFMIRQMSYQALATISDVLAQLALNGHIDKDLVINERMYSLWIGTAAGEMMRKIKLTSFVENSPAARKAIIESFLNLGSKFMHTPLKTSYTERYLGGDKTVIKDIRRLFLEDLSCDIEDISDEEIEAALAEWVS